MNSTLDTVLTYASAGVLALMVGYWSKNVTDLMARQAKATEDLVKLQHQAARDRVVVLQGTTPALYRNGRRLSGPEVVELVERLTPMDVGAARG